MLVLETEVQSDPCQPPRHTLPKSTLDTDNERHGKLKETAYLTKTVLGTC